jgi:hypothetical protein
VLGLLGRLGDGRHAVDRHDRRARISGLLQRLVIAAHRRLDVGAEQVIGGGVSAAEPRGTACRRGREVTDERAQADVSLHNTLVFREVI